jgi:putative MATE family efflux protein
MTDTKTIQAPFVSGSIMRHVLKATAAGTAALICMFLVDFLNLYYIAQLGRQELTAAIGFASILMFFQTSLSMGFMIAGGALVGRATGAGNRHDSERLITSSFIFTTLGMIALTVLMLMFIPEMLDVMGAKGEAKLAATRFLYISTPSAIFIGWGMLSSALLRAIGDVKRSSLVTLIGAIITAILDPILIFGFKMGLDGAAITTGFSRLACACLGIYWLLSIHKIKWTYARDAFKSDCKNLSKLALPALLTNIATPVSLALATGYIARFGEDAVAGFAIVNRLVPLAFCVFFTLSGAIGAVIAQNYGAKQFDRVRESLSSSLKIVIIYGIFAWAMLALLAPTIAGLFDAKGEALTVTLFFCRVACVAWVFSGGLFVANAAFNNLGFASTSMIFNWGRATIGNLPFMWGFVAIAGMLKLSPLEAAILGQGVGGIIFSIAGVWWCKRMMAGLK